MLETATFFHQLEWPAPGARVAGPLVWVRGWVTGKPGFDFVDIRVCCTTGSHLGVVGLPRADLAAHFKSPRPWLPAEYVVGVPLPEGAAELSIEAMDEFGNWHRLQSLALTVAADGEPSPRVGGEVTRRHGGSATFRVPHLPFHGHLDLPNDQPSLRDGRIELFGWLLHETQAVSSVFATFDGLVFNALESGLTDESLAAKVPQHAAARHARVRGGIDAPPTLTSPACLRVYAELADNSVHLCFARRLEPQWTAREQAGSPTRKSPADISSAGLPPLSSARPRRLLTVVRSLQPDDATLRALDVVRHLIASTRWAVRLVASEDGPLHAAFEASGCPVQLVDPRDYFAALQAPASEAALQALGRTIWWKHLNGVAIFDPASTWADKLAKQHHVPVFVDPAESLAWYAPSPVFTADAKGGVIAPVRGLAAQGAGVLLHAADQLTRHHARIWQGRSMTVSDIRNTSEEILFKASVERTTAGASRIQLSSGLAADGQTVAAAAVVCPVFSSHPHRTLLSALAAGVPVITTPSPLMAATFSGNEISQVPPGNPLALAHAIADVLANPVATHRRAAAAARKVGAAHAPSAQLPRWQALLEASVRA